MMSEDDFAHWGTRAGFSNKRETTRNLLYLEWKAPFLSFYMLFLMKPQHYCTVAPFRYCLQVVNSSCELKTELRAIKRDFLKSTYVKISTGSIFIYIHFMQFISSCFLKAGIRWHHFSVNWDDTHASPHFKLVNTNFKAFVHCSSELNWILKKRKDMSLRSKPQKLSFLRNSMTWVFRWKAFGFRSVKLKNHAIFVLTNQRKHCFFNQSGEKQSCLALRGFPNMDYGFLYVFPHLVITVSFPALDREQVACFRTTDAGFVFSRACHR